MWNRHVPRISMTWLAWNGIYPCVVFWTGYLEGDGNTAGTCLKGPWKMWLLADC